MNERNEKRDWVKLFFKWLSEFTMVLIDDILVRRFIGFGIMAFGISVAVVTVYKVVTLFSLFKC